MKPVDYLSKVFASLMFVMVVLFAPHAMATTASDVIVGIKTLPLLSDRPSGDIAVALIYNPDSAASKDDADTVMLALNRTTGDITSKGVMVPVNNLKKLAGTRAAFLMQGVRGSMDAIYEAANAAHVLTMSSDLSCVRANRCVLGILTGGSAPVEIYYSKEAAEAAKVSFVQAFMMLVKRF